MSQRGSWAGFLRSSQFEWMLVAAAMMFALVGFFFRGSATPLQPGLRQRKTFTFVPSDRLGLECRSNLPGLEHCSTDDPAERIVPAVTTQKMLLLVKGVLAAPAFDPSPRERRKRFELNCDVTFERQFAGVEIRFSKQADFSPTRDVWLVRATYCSKVQTIGPQQ